MNRTFKLTLSTLVLGACMTDFTNAQTIFSGGDTTVAVNWDNGLPTSGNDGTINVSGTGPSGAQNTATFAGATITVGGGATVTFAVDVSAGNTDWIVNDGTLDAGDDIFSNNSTLTFNIGSFGIANDDFEAQNTGTINIFGGTHTAGDYFGFQGAGGNTATLNFLGGTVTAGRLRFDATVNSANGNIGGSATANAIGTTAIADLDGDVDILSGWSGSLTAANFTGTDWQTVVTGSWSLDGTAIDSTVFANNFLVSGGGTTLALVPEPSSMVLALLGGGFFLLRRRR